eukprot:5239140-Pyramimonas_sp.AAC.1
MSNWARSSRRRRALPLSRGLVQGMAAVATLRGWNRTAAALLVGFACLLRSGEVVSVVKRQFTVLGGGTAVLLSLPDSKGAKRHGQ